MVKEKNLKATSASDFAASIYHKLCDTFGATPCKEDEQELRQSFDQLLAGANVDFKEYEDEDGSTVTMLSATLEPKCEESEEDNKNCQASKSDTVSMLGRMGECNPETACDRCQKVEDLPRDSKTMTMRDKIFANHRAEAQKEQQKNREAYESYLADLITDKLEKQEFEYFGDPLGEESGIKLSINEQPSIPIIINVARCLKTDQGWSRIEYKFEEAGTSLRLFY